MNYKTLTDLEVYQESRKLRIEISKLTKTKFPPHEKYKLTDQIIRSSQGVTASIAEGFGRFHYQENTQFCRISRGSLLETLDHLIVALDEEYITAELFNNYKKQIDSCGRLLNGYINYLKSKKLE